MEIYSVAPASDEIPAAAANALYASLLVATGSCIRGDLRFLIGLPVTAAGLAAAARAVSLAGEWRSVRWRTPACLLLWPMAIVGILAPVGPGALWYDAACRSLFLFGAIGVAVLYRRGAPASQRIVTAILIGYAVLQIVTPIGVADPGIDVFVWTQTALDALRHGTHPYIVRIADNTWLRPTAAVYPYMPATLLAFFPAFFLFGDCRVLSAVAVPAAAALTRVTGRRLGVDAAFLDATTLAFVLHPRSTSITYNAWNESLLVFALTLFTYIAVRKPAGRAQAIAFFLLASLKQYMAAPLLLFIGTTPPRQRVSHVALAAAIAGLTVAPFLLWNWQATLHGIVTQMVAPDMPRVDSTSFVALVAVEAGVSPTRWLSIVVHFAAAAVTYAYLRRRGLGGLLLASATTLTATFLAGWQAFVNYYYLADVMFLTAAIVLEADSSQLTAVSCSRGGRPAIARSPSASLRATACGEGSS
jgi:hypothetical protein